MNAQERIKRCLKSLAIDTDQFGTFAKVQSCSKANKSYRVDIDESGVVPVASHCSCPASTDKCIHVQAINYYYQQIAAYFAMCCVMEAAQETMTQHIDDVAAQSEMEGEQRFADIKAEQAYKSLSPTKTKCVWSLKCPHRVPEGKEHEECGCCLDRLFG